MKTKQFAILIFLLLIVCGCDKKNDTNIKSIYVLYYNYSFEPMIPIDCDKIKKKLPSKKKENHYSGISIRRGGVLEKTIKSKKLLKEIENEIVKLQPDTSIDYIDARISCFIRYKDGREDRLCIGGYFANDIFYNGQCQIQNNKLLFLIKNAVNYYSWMDGEKYLKYQDELNDKSLIRDSVEDRSGKKY